MDNDLKQAYLDIVAKNKKRSSIFKKIILGVILLGVATVALIPQIAALLLIGVFTVVLFLGVIYSIYTLAESEAESAYEATLEKDPNAPEPLNVDNVVETYIKGLGDEKKL